MGPRPFGRGMMIRTAAKPSRSINFNGAATFRSRNVDMGDKVRPQGLQLQWGRDLSVAECGKRAAGHARKGATSMGPRPFGRGMINAATADQAESITSMGPRPFGRGMPRRPAAPAPAPDFNGAATFRSRNARPQTAARAPSLTSMGPRPFGRGMAEPRDDGRVRDATSMGPRPFGRGMLKLYLK